MPGYRAESSIIEHPDAIKSQWLDLQDRADCSYFQSWGWIGNWLEQIAMELRPWVVRVWLGDALVGIGVFVQQTVTRHLLVRSNVLFLNESPLDGRNMVIEYNGLLADTPHQRAVYRETVKHLLRTKSLCDEIIFSAISDGDVLQGIAARKLETSPTWSVDLDGFDQGVDAYLSTLSKNRRSQIRRSLRLYEAQGTLQLNEAGNPEEAELFFDGLKVLHTARWKTKGEQGSFANPLWERFHRAVIRSRFGNGEIQLIKVSNGNGTIGYLYNFIWRKRVYVLQTGFEISENRQFMPGYVVHSMAIAYNKKKGMKVYDLLHGDSLYKRILCNQKQMLYWLAVQKKRLKFSFEDFAVDVVRKFRSQPV